MSEEIVTEVGPISPEEAEAKAVALLQIEYNTQATKFNNIIEPYWNVEELKFINFQYAFDPNDIQNFLHRYLIQAADAGWVIEVKQNRQVFVMASSDGNGSLVIESLNIL